MNLHGWAVVEETVEDILVPELVDRPVVEDSVVLSVVRIKDIKILHINH